MTTNVLVRRNFTELTQRRQQAATLFEAGEIMASVAKALRVSRQSVSRWWHAWKKKGPKALEGAGRAGRKPKLCAAQLEKVDLALREGARSHKFNTELWTLPRIALVIKKITGIEYHPAHVWKILRALKWTLQKPAKRARERNEAAVRQWVCERWPALKKTAEEPVDGSCSSTKPVLHKGRRSVKLGRPGEKRRS
jgi:transposase